MAVLKWYCGECRKVLQVKMTFFVCIFRSKNIIFVPSAVRDCVSKVLVFLFHIYKMKTHKLLKRFQVYKRKVRFWNIFQFTTWKKHVSDTFFNFKTRKPPFWSSFIFKKCKITFLKRFLHIYKMKKLLFELFFKFTTWKQPFWSIFSF